MRVESLASGRPEMRQTLDRAEKFLNLVALLSALLAAVAVAIAARDFAQRHLDDCADAARAGRSRSARSRWSYALEFGGVGLVASGLGVLLGLAVHHVFVWHARQAWSTPASCRRRACGRRCSALGVGMTLLVGFGLPPVLQLARVPPLRVIRRDVGALQAGVAGWCWRPAWPASSRCCWRCRRI